MFQVWLKVRSELMSKNQEAWALLPGESYSCKEDAQEGADQLEKAGFEVKVEEVTIHSS